MEGTGQAADHPGQQQLMPPVVEGIRVVGFEEKVAFWPATPVLLGFMIFQDCRDVSMVLRCIFI